MDLLLLLQELTLLMQVVAEEEVDPIHQLHLVEQVEEEQEVIVDLFGQHQEHTLLEVEVVEEEQILLIIHM